MNMDQDILLQMTDITKTFPGVKAETGNRPCSDGRKRRRQIHADEVPVRHL